MHEIQPFWAGAQRFIGSSDLGDLARRAGGWSRLVSSNARDLQDLGVEPERAVAWTRQPAVRTTGLPVTYASEHYPPGLKGLPGAPPVLIVEGNPGVLAQRAVAVVGTRKCTGYGEAVARHLGAALARRGIRTVSGLAAGIDGAVHRSAPGSTIGVLGHGLAHMVPAHHRELRRRIIEDGGCVVTSFPDNLEPARWTFPVRNRWIAGIGSCCVVVEAPVKSGALLTAAEAAGLGRPVYAVPGPLGAATSAGCLALLARGALVIDDVEGFCDRFAEVAGSPTEPLLDAIGLMAHPEELADRLGLRLPDVLRQLVKLELEGKVVRGPGQRYVRIGGGP